MKLILWALIAGIGLMGGMTRAGDSHDPSNGHFIAEPELKDYVRAERSPGFSPITEIQDAEGNPVQN